MAVRHFPRSAVFDMAAHKQIVCENCGSAEIVPSSSEVARRAMGRSVLVRPVVRQEVSCPWCAELILREAHVCRYCQRDVSLPDDGG